MIAKRILRTSGQDNASVLGQYIADASHEGEKCLLSWHEGCLAPDYDLALAEIEATQAMNTRCQRDKTYHLMVSFRPEDEAKLTPEAFQDIERAMANALCLSEHQRVCGVHKNTNNLHLHIAYNLIRPDQFTINEPYYDFFKLSKSCRAMEEKFGLEIDKGVEEAKDKQLNQRAAAMEAHSGEQSFQSFALDRKSQIIGEVAKAASWQEAHRVLSGYGIGIKEQGNGLALVNLQGKETMKASALDRSLSKAKLVARFGAYAQP
ncbi:MAG: relaxase/mobilization nuclease domain-containing protein, partial [Candidatus Azobacteroides sp.]|nr:relaxase/mobilization nuclease domain-containing protein [Candidatus Azobacteroides sp.]